jgi:hypothetical protein
VLLSAYKCCSYINVIASKFPHKLYSHVTLHTVRAGFALDFPELPYVVWSILQLGSGFPTYLRVRKTYLVYKVLQPVARAYTFSNEIDLPFKLPVDTLFRNRTPVSTSPCAFAPALCTPPPDRALIPLTSLVTDTSYLERSPTTPRLRVSVVTFQPF